MNWFYSKDGQQVGPVAFPEIERLLAAGELTGDSLVWQEGTPSWVKLSTLTPAAPPLPAAEAAPPAVPEIPPATPVPAQAPIVPAAAPAKANTLAIVSLVLGVLGIFCCGIVFGPAAAICGHIALKQIKENPLLPGRGLALAGTILGYAGFVLHVLYFIFVGAAQMTAALHGAQ